jgi:hypothetical protein
MGQEPIPAPSTQPHTRPLARSMTQREQRRDAATSVVLTRGLRTYLEAAGRPRLPVECTALGGESNVRPAAACMKSGEDGIGRSEKADVKSPTTLLVARVGGRREK